MQNLAKSERKMNKSRNKTKKTSFKKQSGRSYRKDKSGTRQQENLHKLLPSILIQVGDRVRVKGKHNGELHKNVIENLSFA